MSGTVAPVIRTSRLFLSPFTLADEAAMVEVIVSDAEVMAYLPGRDEIGTEAGRSEVAALHRIA